MQITSFRLTINGERGKGKTTIIRLLREILKTRTDLYASIDIVPVPYELNDKLTSEIYDIEVVRKDSIVCDNKQSFAVGMK